MTLRQLKLECILRELVKFEWLSPIEPLEKTDLLWLLFDDFQFGHLNGDLPVEGIVAWQALLAACRERSASAKQKARELYEWLRKTFLPLPRLRICLESWTLILDGVAYSNVEPTILQVIAILDRARNAAGDDKDTVFVPEKTIKAEIGPDLGEKAIRRLRKRLPPELKELIRSQSGKGLALVLPSR